jgi:hypothetical protein
MARVVAWREVSEVEVDVGLCRVLEHPTKSSAKMIAHEIFIKRK